MGDPSSIAEARRFACAAAGTLVRETSDHLQLLVSELATNAIRHANSAFTVVLDRLDDSIRVEVIDGGPGMAQLLDPTPEQPSGRGLRIVAALASDWGVVYRPNGKSVWFVISV